MSVSRSQKSPTVSHADVGHKNDARRARLAAPAIGETDPCEGTLGPVPPPLPADPAVRAELHQRLERGVAAARVGVGEEWEVVHAKIRARLNLPPL